ncbi:hypothetical protein [Autumnicola psychrophila]|uniref:Uncharacterized protein n=1 Tax=Autumnicola psychrophila TaxID=3075592 RepID=A0ABU3DSJ7_9FLAO|nr:hypothetical protein [Zunongwangia sp. F225]MDT0686689.1 hypothetical protein [Zunongwangia sp. F225]
MKFRFLLFFIFSMSIYTSNAQEYWDPEDFEIGNREIKSPLLEVGFVWVQEKQFNLPSGEYLNKDPYVKKSVDLRAVLAQQKNQKPRTVEIDLRLPQKEKKAIEISSGENEFSRNQNFSPNPFYPYGNSFGRQDYLRNGSRFNRHYSNFQRIYF